MPRHPKKTKTAHGRGSLFSESGRPKDELAAALRAADEVLDSDAVESAEEAEQLRAEAHTHASRLLSSLQGSDGKYQAMLLESVLAAMERVGISQVELSKKTGISKSVLSRLLRGERPFTLRHLLKLETPLMFNISSLVSGDQLQHIKNESRIFDAHRRFTEMTMKLPGRGVPPSLEAFLKENHWRMTMDEIDFLVTISGIYVDRGTDPGPEKWLDYVRESRRLDNWPPPPPGRPRHGD